MQVSNNLDYFGWLIETVLGEPSGLEEDMKDPIKALISSLLNDANFAISCQQIERASLASGGDSSEEEV